MLTGDVSLLEIFYSENGGVHAVKFSDEARIWNLGSNSADLPVDTLSNRYYFDDDTKWLGIHGFADSDDVQTLGIITMDPQCRQ